VSAIRYGENAVFDTQLDAIEHKFGVSLPADYREFMLKHNGLRLNVPKFSVEFPVSKIDGDVTFFYLHQIYDDMHIKKNSNLAAVNERFLCELEHVPGAFIIGSDNSTDKYVMICSGHRAGCYFWDRDHFYSDFGACDIDEVDESGKLYKVTDNFSDFYQLILNNIKDYSSFYDGL